MLIFTLILYQAGLKAADKNDGFEIHQFR